MPVDVETFDQAPEAYADAEQYVERVDGLLTLVVTLAVLAVILGGLARLASSIRRRGVGDAVMGPFDEIWHATAHTARIEIRQHDERTVQSPSPSDL